MGDKQIKTNQPVKQREKRQREEKTPERRRFKKKRKNQDSIFHSEANVDSHKARAKYIYI